MGRTQISEVGKTQRWLRTAVGADIEYNNHTCPLVVARNVGFCRDHKPPTTVKKSTVAPVKMRKAYKIPKYDHCKKASPSSGKQW